MIHGKTVKIYRSTFDKLMATAAAIFSALAIAYLVLWAGAWFYVVMIAS